MKACRSGSAKNFWKCSTLSHSSTTRTNPSPMPNLWWSPPAALDSSASLAYSPARSTSD